MPGCSLPSYSPENIAKTINYLRAVYPELSVVQKCCGKPTKSLGQVELLKERFGSLVADIKDCKVDEMLVACQNCYNMLRESDAFTTASLWERIPEIGLPSEVRGKAAGSDVVFSIHDSCPVRDNHAIHDGIRWILRELGYNTAEPERTRGQARCCGFGGMIVPVNPALAKKVMDRRVKEMPTEHIVVYCAACRSSMLMGGGKAWHILDLIFGPVVTKSSQPPENVLASPVKAWVNRYKAKGVIARAIR
jgi:Fe-S oxidoreductase